MPGDVLCVWNLPRSPIVQEFHKNVSISALLKRRLWICIEIYVNVINICLYHITYCVVVFNDDILFRSVEEKANSWGNECEIKTMMQRSRPWTQGWGGGHTLHQRSENKGFRRTRQDLNGSCLATAWVLEVVIKVNVCSACLHDCRLYSLLFGLVNVTGDRALSYVCTHKADLMPLSLGWIVLAVNHGHLAFMKIGSGSLNTEMPVPQKRDTHCSAI